MSKQNKPQTLAEQLQEEELNTSRLDEATALRVAHKVKWAIDEEVSAKRTRKNLPGLRNIFKRSDLKGAELYHSKRREQAEAEVESQISFIEQRQSSYLARRFYNYVKERASGLGLDRIAQELEYELEHSPHETYDYSLKLWKFPEGAAPANQAKFIQEKGLRDIIVSSSNIIASPEEDAEDIRVISTGKGNNSHNPLVRAGHGFGAQGEEHADLNEVDQLLSLLGIEDRSEVPKSLPDLGHFSLGFPILTSFLSKHEAFRMPEYEDMDFRLNFKFIYSPESTRSSYEDVIYEPDRLLVRISKTPNRYTGGGRGAKELADIGKLATENSEI